MIDFEELKGKLRGPTVLVMTPFKDNYELNLEALQENIRFIIDGGIGNGKDGSIICPCGNGEYASLSPEENKMVVEAAVEVAGDKLPVVAGCHSCDYRAVIDLALNAAEAGAKCVMIPPPYYYRISQEGIYRWYKLIAEETKTKVGIMAYPHAWRVYTHGFISAPLLGKLAEIESIVALKFVTKEGIRDYIKILSLYSERFSFLNNSNYYSKEVPHMHGEAGIVTGAAVFWPELVANYWSLLEQGKYKEASKLNAQLIPYFEFLMKEDFTEAESPFLNASVVKAALEYVGLYGGPVRPPFVGLTEEQKRKFFGILEAIGVPKKR